MATDFTIFTARAPLRGRRRKCGSRSSRQEAHGSPVCCHCPCIPCQVDPQGGVTYQDETVERDGKPEEQGQSWQEAWMPWAVASVAFWPRN